MIFYTKIAQKVFISFGLLIFSILFFACKGTVLSSLLVKNGENTENLIALNACAKNATIENPQKSSYMYFAFDAEKDFDKNAKSLEILVTEMPKPQIPGH